MGYLDQYLVGGATRPDAISGLDPAYRAIIEKMIQGAPVDIARELRITSAYRNPERQQQLWDQALKKYGDPEIADNWVARPGGSQHEKAHAIDWKFGSPAAREWAHANAGKYGASFPLLNEPWHMEKAGARGGATPAGVSLATTPISAPPLAGPGGSTIGNPFAGAMMGAGVGPAPAAPGMASGMAAGMGGMGGIGSALGTIAQGIMGKQGIPAETDITPSSISNDVGADDDQFKKAKGLWEQLMGDKRKEYFGLSLPGIGGF